MANLRSKKHLSLRRALCVALAIAAVWWTLDTGAQGCVRPDWVLLLDYFWRGLAYLLFLVPNCHGLSGYLLSAALAVMLLRPKEAISLVLLCMMLDMGLRVHGGIGEGDWPVLMPLWKFASTMLAVPVLNCLKTHMSRHLRARQDRQGAHSS